MKEIPREIWGSLQDHHAVCEIRGGGQGVCPAIACTDFGLPRILFEVIETDTEEGEDSILPQW